LTVKGDGVTILVTYAFSGADLVRIITESRLTAFWNRFPDAELPLRAWRAMIRRKEYRTPHEVRQDFGSADFLRSNVTVFNIGGNKYRLVVTMRYDMQTVFIRHVVTHREYDRLTDDGLL
jgi:mRNA interferase HigB